jgi:hypothetical protein
MVEEIRQVTTQVQQQQGTVPVVVVQLLQHPLHHQQNRLKVTIVVAEAVTVQTTVKRIRAAVAPGVEGNEKISFNSCVALRSQLWANCK